MVRDSGGILGSIVPVRVPSTILAEARERATAATRAAQLQALEATETKPGQLGRYVYCSFSNKAPMTHMSSRCG